MIPMSDGENGWNEWSKHILKELERLNDNYESLRVVNEEIKVELGHLASVKNDIDDIKVWRSKIEEVFSPTQLKELSNDVSSLKNFKTVAITIWAVVQFITSAVIALFKYS